MVHTERAYSGGKGANLLLLKEAGFPVPEFVVLPVDFFSGADEAAIKAKVRQAIPELMRQLPAAQLLAVRSSATAEDNANFSFAGQFRTLLNVPLEQLPQAVYEVWSSATGAAVNAYREHGGLSEIRMAVVVQRMIPADFSGVAFAVNPLTGNENEHVVNMVAGTGEELVSGNVNGDTYLVKGRKVYVERTEGASAIADNAKVLLISEMLSKLSAFFNCPQDMEFAFLGADFYLLQSRPVTTIKKQEQITWDNSNIVESYPGLTLPLTFSFIEKMYAAVYEQLSGVLGIGKKRIAENTSAYQNMLGLLNGRVYYNLNSWYRVLSLLPGYKMNAGFMEKMMGVKEKPDINIPQTKAGFRDYIDVFFAIMALVRNLLTVRKQKKHFVAAFNQTYDGFRGKAFAAQSITDTLRDYHRFEQLMVKKWKAPLVNDFFAMVYFGLLNKLCARYFPDLPNLHNQLLAGSRDIVTTEPIRRFPELVSALMSDPDLKRSLLERDAADTWTLLQQPQFAGALSIINAFIDDWGERCVAELKLETVTYKQDPTKLVAILKSYASAAAASSGTTHTANLERPEAEQTVSARFKGRPVRRLLFGHVLKQARYLVSNRENLRYYRTRGFGMVRQMFLGMGERMVEEGLLQHTEDIFYLKLEETEQIASGDLPREGIARIIEGRKKDYLLYGELNVPERIVTNGKPGNIILADSMQVQEGTGGELQGIPCSAGVVRAKVRLLHYADELLALDNAIMATYATDPGWVVLFPSASGILTERGSLLSHAAIVSREMGIPCIVGVTNLMSMLKDGDEILMDGGTGLIKILGNHRGTI